MSAAPHETELTRLRDLARQGPASTPLPPQLWDRLRDVTLDATADEEPTALPDIIGEYRIVAERGRGGMGVVYEALDERLGRRVAVKVLMSGRFADAKARERFRREARTAASLRHDHLVPVFAAETPDDGPPYLVMPFIDGPTLADRIAAERVIAPSVAARIAMQIADGLAAAHAAGIVHRDVKPGNILMDRDDDRAKLTDFGLARDDVSNAITSAGTIAGTPNYLSPEQVHTPDAVDARADVYALGATLYECLTGVPPFRGATLDVLRMIADSEPVPPQRLNRDVPRDLETIVLKCLEKEPGRRYATANELKADLERYLSGHLVLARPQGQLTVMVKWVKRNRPLAGLTATLIVALLAGSITSFILWQRAERNAATARHRQEESERNLRAALAVVDRFCTRVSEEELLRQPGLQPVRKKLLGDAVEHYRSFVEARQNDPAARADVASALARLSRVSLELGGLAEATAMRRDALALHETLLQEAPANPAATVAVAEDYLELSECLRLQRDYPAAAVAAVNAANRFSEWAAHGNNSLGRLKTAMAWNAAGQAEIFCDPPRSDVHFQMAVNGFESLIRDEPANIPAQAELAGALQSWASSRMTQAELPKLEQARKLRLAVCSARPDSDDARLALANADINLGVLYKWGGRIPDATRSYLSAIDAFAKVVEENPKVVAWRRHLARAHYNLARLHHQERQRDDSIRHHAEAQRHFAILCKAESNDDQSRIDLALATVGLAAQHAARKDVMPAAANATEAIPLIESLVNAELHSLRQRSQIVELLRQLAEIAAPCNCTAESNRLISRHMQMLLTRRNDPNLRQQYDAILKGMFTWRVEQACDQDRPALPSLLKEWLAAFPDSVESLAYEARAAAEDGNAAIAKSLFETAILLGWIPPPEWCDKPALRPFLPVASDQSKNATK